MNRPLFAAALAVAALSNAAAQSLRVAPALELRLAPAPPAPAMPGGAMPTLQGTTLAPIPLSLTAPTLPSFPAGGLGDMASALPAEASLGLFNSAGEDLGAGLSAVAAPFDGLRLRAPGALPQASPAADGAAASWEEEFRRVFNHPLEPGVALHTPEGGLPRTFERLLARGKELGRVMQMSRSLLLFVPALSAPSGQPFSQDLAESRLSLSRAVKEFNHGERLAALDLAADSMIAASRHLKAPVDPAVREAYDMARTVLRNIASDTFLTMAAQYKEHLLKDQGQPVDPILDEVLKAEGYLKSAFFSRDSKVWSIEPPAQSGGAASGRQERFESAPKPVEFNALKALVERFAQDLPAFTEQRDDIQRAMGVLRAFVQDLQPDPPAGQAPGTALVKAVQKADPQRYALDSKLYPMLTSDIVTNLNMEALRGKLDPLVGRKKELDALARTLTRYTKPNVAVIGPEGVGKTALIEGLAQAIVDGKYPELQDKILLRVDLGSLVAGTTLRGQFEERVKLLIKEAEKLNRKVILYTDEMHMMLGLGDGQGAATLANLIKPAITKGLISLIGATTFDEWRKVEKDKALKRRFKPLKLLPSSAEEALAILKNLLPRLSGHHKRTIGVETAAAAVELSDRYITDRHQPDKSIDVMDEAAALARQRDDKAVTPEHVAEVVSEWTGVPVAKMSESEEDSLLQLPGRIKGRLVNQDEAVDEVTTALVRNRAGLGEENKTMGAFLFLGPTGVGKTELVRLLAELQFGSVNNMVRLDGSDYSEKHTVSRLVGPPPGYVGFEETAGDLTEPVRLNPYRVVLFDEIEEAHPQVVKLLLQVMEDGFLKDSRGNLVDFRNTILILTSNLGGQKGKKSPLGFIDAVTQDRSVDKQAVIDEAKKFFEAKFYNRLDAMIVFNGLGREDMKPILEIQLAYLNKRLAKKGLRAEFTQAAKDLILKKGYDPNLGARPLKRALKGLVEDPLSFHVVKKVFGKGDVIKVDVKDGRIDFSKAPAEPASGSSSP